MQARPKQAWIRPELTPLTDTGARSDSVDTPQRNLNGTILN
jgi:hypothetical protein